VNLTWSAYGAIFPIRRSEEADTLFRVWLENVALPEKVPLMIGLPEESLATAQISCAAVPIRPLAQTTLPEELYFATKPFFTP